MKSIQKPTLKINLVFLLITPFLFVFQNCSNQLDSQNPQPSLSPYFNADDFKGALEAKNVISGVRIIWNSINENKKCIGYKVYRFNFNKPELLSTVGPDETEYIDGSIDSGVRYKYLVKAVDPDNNEDANNSIVTAIGWRGITSVESDTNNSITVKFDAKLQGYTLKLSLSGEGKSTELIKEISLNSELETGEYIIEKWPDNSPLKPGAKYTVMAEIYDKIFNLSDGNTRKYTVNLKTFGFDQNQNSPPGWNNVATVRAFGRSPGTEAFPVATVNAFDYGKITPSDAQIEIGFLPFNLPNGLDPKKYRFNIIRAGETTAVDTTNLDYKICKSVTNFINSPENIQSLLEPCLVPRTPGSLNEDFHPINSLNNGLIYMRDIDVWPSNLSGKPHRYRYIIVIKHLNTESNDVVDTALSGYREYLKQENLSKFSHIIPVPPDHMVLVNREAANFEFCRVQKNLAPDPFNFNRCENKEVGQTPYNSGIGNSKLIFDNNYFDMGYSFFVDRYPLSCNSPTDFYSNTNSNQVPPPNTFVPTAENAVALSFLGNTNNTGITNCSIYNPTDIPGVTSARWIDPVSFENVFGILSDEKFRRLLTNKPSTLNNKSYKYPYKKWTNKSAMIACNAFSETGYGKKRIPRMREYRALMAPPFKITISGKNVLDFNYSLITTATAANNTAPQATTEPWNSGDCVIGNISANDITEFTALNSGIPSSIEYMNNSANNQSNFAMFSLTGNPVFAPNFLTGSKHTRNCVSKYGVSQILDTLSLSTQVVRDGVVTSWYPLSDMFFWTRTNITNMASFDSPSSEGRLNGRVSLLDSGNIDNSIHFISGESSIGYQINYLNNKVMSLNTPGTTTSVYFNSALGLPYVNFGFERPNNTDLPTLSANYNQPVILIRPTMNENLVYSRATARYTTGVKSAGPAAENDDDVISQVRCVLPAE